MPSIVYICNVVFNLFRKNDDQPIDKTRTKVSMYKYYSVAYIILLRQSRSVNHIIHFYVNEALYS